MKEQFLNIIISPIFWLINNDTAKGVIIATIISHFSYKFIRKMEFQHKLIELNYANKINFYKKVIELFNYIDGMLQSTIDDDKNIFFGELEEKIYTIHIDGFLYATSLNEELLELQRLVQILKKDLDYENFQRKYDFVKEKILKVMLQITGMHSLDKIARTTFKEHKIKLHNELSHNWIKKRIKEAIKKW